MHKACLSTDLANLLKSEGDESLTIRTLVERVGDKGFGLLLVVLSLPSALPVPAAGYSVPFGILLLILAVQMLLGKSRPVFPAKLESVELKTNIARKMISAASWFFLKIEWAIKPRMKWVGNYVGRVLMALLVLLMAILMMIPIPMTNTLPAFVIFLIGIGLTEEDGLFAIAASIAGMIAAAFYIGLVIAMIHYGPEVADTIKETIKSWISSS